MPKWPKRRPNSIVLNGRVIHLRPLCRKYALDPSYVSRILSGKQPIDRIPTGVTLILADALNCTVEELMRFVELRRIAIDSTSDDQPVLNTPVV